MGAQTRSPNSSPPRGITSSRVIVPELLLPKERDPHGSRKIRSRSRPVDASIPRRVPKCEKHFYKTRSQAGSLRRARFGGIRRDTSRRIRQAISHQSDSTTVRNRQADRRDRKLLRERFDASYAASVYSREAREQ